VKGDAGIGLLGLVEKHRAGEGDPVKSVYARDLLDEIHRPCEIGPESRNGTGKTARHLLDAADLQAGQDAHDLRGGELRADQPLDMIQGKNDHRRGDR